MNYEYCNGITHTIKKGDSLYEISRRHGVPLALILRANPYVDVFHLQVGDTICIPKETSQEPPYPLDNPQEKNPVLPMPQEPRQSLDGEGQSEPRTLDGTQEAVPETRTQREGAASETQESTGTAMQQEPRSEQMDEMMVWSERATSSREQPPSMPQAAKREWMRYVVQPGDTMAELSEKMSGDWSAFWDKNNPESVYLLPGVACYVWKS